MTHNFLYRCPKSTVPYHLTLPNLHPHVHYEGSGAGNIVFTAMQLKLINGYGSAFWDCSPQRTESQAPEDMKYLLLEDLGFYGLNTSRFEKVSCDKLDDDPLPIWKMAFKLECDMDLTPWCKQ
ncbi:uncharacterized protein Gasu_16710 [Galdieria sulphuraria]|uniref:Uncharacterized protein n=1 Tax=Galdieria sulphuraria TaxID=130081 RepID=M2Y5D5_GALSU|nr:uncharacterized protein Gasu_16710 [Galdieria sulphuraria]EME31178.1 hypothetical protein Gasu_16710 [Galdieria sulphuraria]|eukprot:XP_005707698.1 hypothetical protein Gasu_16710 [Galdieria sulphuraria]